jgi:ATP-binding cassette subfamily G (WHITE) protein 2 (SNQ2)
MRYMPWLARETTRKTAPTRYFPERRAPIRSHFSDKSSHAPSGKRLHRSTRVAANTLRQIQVMWGDRWSNTMQIASAMIMALTTGSLFYNLPEDSTSIFPRPGAIFFPILFFALNKMSETTASFMGRRIVSRHKRLAFSRPSAFAIACMLTDIPLIIFTFTLFQIIFYFMTGQRMEAGVFFTSWIILILCTLCFASLYRMIGAWCKHFGFASQISGWITMVYLLYGGEDCGQR